MGRDSQGYSGDIMTPDQEKAIELIAEAAGLLNWAMALCPSDTDVDFVSAIILGPLDSLAGLGDLINPDDGDLH